MSSLNIIGIDPGKATGVFALSIDIPTATIETQAAITAAPSDVYTLVSRMIEEFTVYSPNAKQNILSVESFVITKDTGKRSQQTDALEIIGQLKTLTMQYPCTMQMQGPSLAKTAVKDARLKKLGLFQAGRENRHMNDAARHAVVVLLQQYPCTLVKMLGEV